MRPYWMLLCAAPGALGCAPRPDSQLEADARVPAGWVVMNPPRADTPAAACANWAEDAWAVALAADSATLLIGAAGKEQMRNTLAVADGALVGEDAGEFGGAIWWEPTGGRPVKLRVEGRDTASFYADNVLGFIPRAHDVYALVGLAHLSLNVGELVRLNRAPGSDWRARHVLDLDGAPVAYTKAGGDTILVLTTDSLLTVQLSAAAPVHRAFYGNAAWVGAYPASLVRDGAGVVYIGMRSAVARITPTAGGYREDWLTPEHCRHRVPAGDGVPCHCEP